MFSIALRLVLILGSLLTISFMLFRIRSSKIAIRDSIFWIIFSLTLLILSLFPELTAWASRLLGIQSPINFVYVFIIFILLTKIFSSSMRISMLDTRIQQLAQRVALNEKELAEADHRPAEAASLPHQEADQ